jgi:hypothetical protein
VVAGSCRANRDCLARLACCRHHPARFGDRNRGSWCGTTHKKRTPRENGSSCSRMRCQLGEGSMPGLSLGAAGVVHDQRHERMTANEVRLKTVLCCRPWCRATSRGADKSRCLTLTHPHYACCPSCCPRNTILGTVPLAFSASLSFAVWSVLVLHFFAGDGELSICAPVTATSHFHVD